MRIKGLEPSLLAKPEPKSGASTNSAISAGNICHYSTSIRQSKTNCRRSHTDSKSLPPHAKPVYTSIGTAQLDRASMVNPDTTAILASIQSLVAVVAKLRDPEGGCPWDLAQTPESLTPYIVEEAYEAVHAIRSGDREAIVSELGDLLLQVILQAQVASEAGDFTLAEVADGIREKLIRRHPHVFGDVRVADVAEVRANWEQIKAIEKGQSTGLLSDKLSSYTEKFPPLIAAMKISKQAAAMGFEWENVDGVWAKFAEELAEFKEALATPDTVHQAAELGDLLFTVVNLARWFKLDPEVGLSGTNQRFVDRIQQMEVDLDRPLSEYTIAELETLWQQAKQRLARKT